jgi:DnaJ-class molecular chaperone
MFEEIFGARGFQQRQRGPRRGQDLQIGISVSFFEAVFGAQKQVNVTYRSRGKQGRKITKTVPVQLPPGADNGMAFTLSGEGAESDSKGGPNGDLLIQVRMYICMFTWIHIWLYI